MSTLEDFFGPMGALAIEGFVRDTCREIVREELRALHGGERAVSESAIGSLVREAVREAMAAQAVEDDIFTKVFQIAPLTGDYVEFGVFRGASFVRAYNAARAWSELLVSGRADHLVDDREALYKRVRALWNHRRFYGFDSFEGMPEPEGVDRERVIWQAGTFAAPRETFFGALDRGGVPREKVTAVAGFFSDTLTDARRVELGIERIAVAHIDSDLYASAQLALAFITPALQNGTVIVFDEWYAYRGHPQMGEQRAFSEWLAAHPDWTATEYHTAGVTSKSFILNHRTARTPFVDRLAEILE